ncbi:MAG: GNAT family N-acetyltransferase [Anaerolineae bacterium]|nr:GNAT family N-acetyltransferase [Anaerolineae bacterium]
MNSSKTYEDLSSQDLMNLIEANLIERSLYFPRLFNGEIHGPNPIWFITGPTLPAGNGVVSATFALGEIDASIEATLAPFKARRLPLKWWVGPATAPQNMGQHLQNHGLTHNRDMMGMATNLHNLAQPIAPPLPKLTFERVKNKTTLAEWYNLLLAGFPISFDQVYLDALALASLGPGTAERHYIVQHRGKTVGISTLFLDGNVAGLYNLVTCPQARGQGIGTWLTIRTYQEALTLGYAIGTLQTTYPNALRLYHRLGFEVYCKIGIYSYSKNV